MMLMIELRGQWRFCLFPPHVSKLPKNTEIYYCRTLFQFMQLSSSSFKVGKSFTTHFHSTGFWHEMELSLLIAKHITVPDHIRIYDGAIPMMMIRSRNIQWCWWWPIMVMAMEPLKIQNQVVNLIMGLDLLHMHGHNTTNNHFIFICIRNLVIFFNSFLFHYPQSIRSANCKNKRELLMYL